MQKRRSSGPRTNLVKEKELWVMRITFQRAQDQNFQKLVAEAAIFQTTVYTSKSVPMSNWTF